MCIQNNIPFLSNVKKKIDYLDNPLALNITQLLFNFYFIYEDKDEWTYQYSTITINTFLHCCQKCLTLY